MGQREIGISFNRDQAYECCAALLTLLACPTDDQDESRRAELHTSLCGKALWINYLLDADNTAPIQVKPQYVFRRIEQIDRDTNFVGRRLKQRYVAGRMAIKFLEAAELGCLPALPPEVKRLSVNEMTLFLLEETGQRDPNNAERRIWIPSKPVIHIAAALVVVGQEFERQGIKLSLEALLLSRELIEAIIQRAAVFEDLITKAPKFPAKAEDLVRVRLG
jgi:hypothetical protein